MLYDILREMLLAPTLMPLTPPPPREMQALQTLRAEAEAAAQGGTAAAGAGDSDPAKLFRLGALAAARVHEVKEYGIVCDMDQHPVRPPAGPSRFCAPCLPCTVAPPACRTVPSLP